MPIPSPFAQLNNFVRFIRSCFKFATFAIFAFQNSPESFHKHKTLCSSLFAVVPQSTTNIKEMVSQPSEASSSGPYYCNSCTNARNSPDHADRIVALFEPLFCSKCGSNHPSMFFSETEETKPSSERICTAWEGKCTACSHIQLELDDIKPSALSPVDPTYKQMQDKSWTCRQPTCWPKRVKATVLSFNDKINMSIEQTDFTENDLSFHSILAGPPAKPLTDGMCAHIGTRAWLADLLLQRENFLEETDWKVKCKVCRSEVSYADLSCLEPDLSDDGSMFIMKRACAFDMQANFCDSAWQDMMDPGTFGLYTDEKWRNVVWCDSEFCPTSRFLSRYTELRYMGTYGCWKWPTMDGERALKSLDDGTLAKSQLMLGRP